MNASASDAGHDTGPPVIRTADVGAVRIITLNRPKRLNAFTPNSYRSLTTVLGNAAADDHIAVALLTGAGRSFCSGVDLVELTNAGENDHDFSDAFDALMDALLRFAKPLVAAVHGVAVGIGFTILLHCDVVLVATDARLRGPFAQLGTAPEAGSSWLLPRAVGSQRAAELLLTSRWLDAAEAVNWGLAARSCEAAQLQSEALATAQAIASHPATATQAAKRLLRRENADIVRSALAAERDTARDLRRVLGPMTPPHR